LSLEVTYVVRKRLRAKPDGLSKSKASRAYKSMNPSMPASSEKLVTYFKASLAKVSHESRSHECKSEEFFVVLSDC
jgi:hypothetical protein